MPMSDGETREALEYIQQAQASLDMHKKDADPLLYDVLKHLVNVVKRLCGDHSSLVE
jgi:hypothetical protein